MGPPPAKQRSVASFFGGGGGGGGPAKHTSLEAAKKREAAPKEFSVKEAQVKDALPASKKPRLQKKSEVEADAAAATSEAPAAPAQAPAPAEPTPSEPTAAAAAAKEAAAAAPTPETPATADATMEEPELTGEVVKGAAPPSPAKVASISAPTAAPQAPPALNATEASASAVTGQEPADARADMDGDDHKHDDDEGNDDDEQEVDADDEDEEDIEDDEDDGEADDEEAAEGEAAAGGKGKSDGFTTLMKGAKKAAAASTGKAKAKPKAKGGKAKGDGAGVGMASVEAAGRLLAYDPSAAVTWKPGEPVPYLFLAEVFESISETTKRIEIAELLTNALRTILASSPDDLLAAVYLASNAIAPQHEGVDLGIGDATLIKALAEATGRKETAIKADYKTEGDLGIVAMESRSTQRTMFTPPPLTVTGVLREFRAIAKTEGKSSVDHKKGRMKKLLVAARGCEAGYLVRALQGKLRIGLAQQTVTTALAHAMVLHAESEAAVEEKTKAAVGARSNSEVADHLGAAVDILKQVFSECPSYDEIIPALLMPGGVDQLRERCHLRVGVPVKPMLAKPTCGVKEVLQRFTDVEFTCEYKYDGERAQIHLLPDGSVKIFSRNQEDNTPKFPDIIRALPGYLKEGITSVVIDCEAVAFDREEKKILPFQILSTRGRKNIDEADIKVNVALYAFDCLYLNGVNLLQEPLTKRREALYSAFKETPGEFMFATAKISRDVEELQMFLEDSIVENTEGLIVKTMDATYEPSKRSLNWLKLKKDYMEGCGDSLDLVPIGAFHGKGKRVGVYGAYLLACYDEGSEELQSICKIGTGFSDEDLKSLTESLRDSIIDEPRSYFKVGESLKPDVWFEPRQVWEVKAADLSVSPVHQAAHGLVDPVKGIALRFPRFLRLREDKGVEQATSAEQVADFYNAQATKVDYGGGDDDDL